MNLKNKKVVIVGLARSGIVVARFIKNQGAFVTVVDNNENPETILNAKYLAPFGIKSRIGKHLISDFSEAQLVVISPGVSHEIPVLKATLRKGIPIVGEIEIAANFINKPIIGVTGTNGKTTTVKLIDKMLTYSSKKVFLCGNVGIPLTESLAKLEHIDVIVAEVSSFQLDTIVNFKPTTSVLLNAAEDHMDRYSSLKHYHDSKLKIFSNQSKSDVSIFNAIDASTKELVTSRKLKAKLMPFSSESVESGAQIFHDSITIFNNKLPLFQIDLTKSKLHGFHNKQNIAAASLAALSEGGNVIGIQSAIDNFEESGNRIETIKYFRGIRFVNDSKATNIHATINALKCFAAPIILIIGGQAKNNSFDPLKSYLLQKKVQTLIIMGESCCEIKSALSCKNISYQFPNIVTTTTLEDAVRKALDFAKPGYTILLSPACASFDQFKNYKHRGLKFKKVVEELTRSVDTV